MISFRQTEIVQRLIAAVPVQVWAVRKITECFAQQSESCEADDNNFRSTPRDLRLLRYSGNVQLRHDIALVGKFTRLQVVKGIETESEFIDRRCRQQTRVRE